MSHTNKELRERDLNFVIKNLNDQGSIQWKMRQDQILKDVKKMITSEIVAREERLVEEIERLDCGCPRVGVDIHSSICSKKDLPELPEEIPNEEGTVATINAIIRYLKARA